jgi:hypothetical protein
MGMIPRNNIYGVGALRSFGEYLTNDSWLDFKDIVIDDKNIFSQQKKSRIGLIDVNSSDGTTQITKNSLYYAKSWALTYYVLSQQHNMQKLYAYFQLVDDGEAAPQAFTKAYDVAVTTIGRTYFKTNPAATISCSRL